MKRATKWAACLAAVGLLGASALGQSSGQPSGSTSPSGQPGATADLKAQARQSIDLFKQKDPTLSSFFQNAAGYAVFPKVTEGALVFGGARGNGVVFQNGQPVGQVTVSKASVGAQAGGQTYSELIFFQTPEALQQFKSGNYQLSAGVSAVAAASGAGQAANYNNGVAVFTASREGLMAQAAVGGQKFSYQPLNEGAVGGSSAPGSSGSSSGESGTAPK